MIDFLLGAFTILTARAQKIIKELEASSTLPAPVIPQCALIAARTRKLLPNLRRRTKVIKQVKSKIAAGQLRFDQAEPILRGSLLAYRDLTRELNATEEYFVGHIKRLIRADLFLTTLSAALWKETNLPGLPPVTVSSTSGYFCTLASLGIIFSPPSVEDHLLILPDLYHEAGHLVHDRLNLFGTRFVAALADHRQALINQVRRTSRPLRPQTISDISARWMVRWAEEVACDTLAARLVGPAYGWCNIHLCLQSPNIYAIGAEHPADIARTQHIFRVLKRLGWGSEVDKMEDHWNRYVRVVNHRTVPHFHDYHPEPLFVAVMEDVEESTRNLNIYGSRTSEVSKLLNEAWREFLTDPTGYENSKDHLMTKLKTAVTL